MRPANRRVKVFDRKARLHRLAFCTAMFVAAVALPRLRADDGKPATALPASKTPVVAAQAVAPFDLRIVGPDDKPVPDARVTLFMTPRPDDVRLRAGTLINKSRGGLVLKSDAEGRVAVERPARLDYLNYQIRAPGYGYYWNWINFQNKANTELTPRTARLERAWTIGGI